MEPKQLILLSVFAALAVASLFATSTRRVAPFVGLVVALSSFLACLAVLWPDLTTRLAQLVGINRGADLVAYATTVVVFVGFLAMYIRLRRVRSDLTRLVRQMAIAEAVEGPTTPPQTAHPDNASQSDLAAPTTPGQ